MTDVKIGEQKKRTKLLPGQQVAEGGEAVIYVIGDKAIKIWKDEHHPDFEGKPDAQLAARLRLEAHQTKLPAFPKNLPPTVIAPLDIVRDLNDRIIGYQMRFVPNTNMFLEFTDRKFREGIPFERVVGIGKSLHGTITGVHAADVIISDFNYLNVLVPENESIALLIDADSMGYAGFKTNLYTETFVDPLHCDPNLPSPRLVKEYVPNADWYAYNVMLVLAILFTHPYGGIYEPTDKTKAVAHRARPLKGVSVFHPEGIIYPKKATPIGALPDDLLHHWFGVFEKQERGPFPIALIESMRWTTCSGCGTGHARAVCPQCAIAAPIAVKETVTVRGTVTATRVFKTNGVILFGTVQRGKLRWLYHERDGFHREDKTLVLDGNLDPRFRYRIKGDSTVIGKDGTVITFTPNQSPERIMTDVVNQRSVFDANADHLYWTEGDHLSRDDVMAPTQIGTIISGLTHIWAGPTFGFGFYRASALNVAFIFDATRAGINDTVKIPKISGQLLDATCVFTDKVCWFLSTSQEGGKTINRCSLIRADGTVEAFAEAEAGDNSWLTSIRGCAAIGKALLVPSDKGVLQIKVDQGKLMIAKEYPDTEPFVSSETRLFAANDGLYAVSAQDIVRLKIA